MLYSRIELKLGVRREGGSARDAARHCGELQACSLGMRTRHGGRFHISGDAGHTKLKVSDANRAW